MRQRPAMNMPIGRKNQLFLVVFITSLVMTFYYFGFWEDALGKMNHQLLRNDTPQIVGRPSGFAVYTTGCRIPELNPFDKSMLKYMQTSKIVLCSEKPPLIQSNQTSIWIDETVLNSYNLSITDLNCCYTVFARKEVESDDVSSGADDMISMHTHCRPFEKNAHIFDEFIEVTCFANDTLIYKDYHAFIVPKQRNPQPGFEKEPEGLSVMIVGVDSLSRQNFYRQMPKTKDFLHSIEAVEFFGYNKVQDNTFPNLVPLLSGYSVKEIQKICWFNDTDFFDDCPWMWKNFSGKNYYTAFAEDCTNIGLFNYLKNGFLNPPTDYYVRPFMYANEKFIGHKKLLNTKYCVGPRLTVDVLMDYAYKFSTNMTESKKKFWAFFWESSLTHDFFNVPPNNDNIYFDFFKKMVDLNLLNTTMVVFMSDHGMRWGSARETYQGRMEEHLPYLFLILPRWFKEKYGLAVRNLYQNTRLLTTHFDLHETIMDVLNEYKLEDEVLEERTWKTRHDRGISLFLPIPMNRTCSSAGIEQSWCTCQTSKRIPPTGKLVRRAAKTVVNYLNMLLVKHKQCAILKLRKVWSALLEDEEPIMLTETVDRFFDYVINFETKPGGGKFEATVRYRSGSNEMTVIGEISRINLYGNQSECVSNYRLKRYCFCET